MKVDTERGVALLMVLWVMVFLMTVVLSFSYMSRVETESEFFFSQHLREEFLLEGLLHRTVVEILYSKAHPAEEGVLDLYGRPNSIQLNGETFQVRVSPENGRLDLNSSSGLILRGLLKNMGVSQERIDIFVDSLLDWRDRDNLHRLNGAEDDYYGSLPRPYKCRNESLRTVEEVLLIRGMDEDLYYGTDGRGGLRDLLTVYSRSAKININTAPRELLLAIPGISEEVVDALIEYRTQQPFRTITEVQAIAGGAYQTLAPYIEVRSGDVYRIVVKRPGGSTTLEAVVRVTKSGYEMLRVMNLPGEAGDGSA